MQRFRLFRVVKNEKDRQAVSEPVVQMVQIAVVDIILPAPAEIRWPALDLQGDQLPGRPLVFNDFDLGVNAEIRYMLLAENPPELFGEYRLNRGNPTELTATSRAGFSCRVPFLITRTIPSDFCKTRISSPTKVIVVGEQQIPGPNL